MKRNILRIAFALLVLSVVSASAFAQGRGRGRGLEKKQDIFVNGRDARNGRFDERGRNKNWKCSVFVNCHDAREGRLDGRGPRVNAGNRHFAARGDRVGNRRYNMSDYWQRRHLTYGTRYNRMRQFR